MKRIMVAVCLLFLFTNYSFADCCDEGRGANMRGVTLSLGANSAIFDYKETVSGSRLDQDYGYPYGGFAEIRMDNSYVFARLNGDYLYTTQAKYSGATQSGTPIQMKTREQIINGELNIGYKALNFSTVTISPYAGIGYRLWYRGNNALPDYQEDYSWFYGAAGVNIAFRAGNWLLQADAAAVMPFLMEMTTDFAGSGDNSTYRIHPRLGYRVELPIRYNFYKQVNGENIYWFMTPYYQYWKIGASDAITITRGGTSARSYEPDSTTDVYGIKWGLGLTF